MKKEIKQKLDVLYKGIDEFLNNEKLENKFVLLSFFALIINNLEEEIDFKEVLDNKEIVMNTLYDYVGTNDFAHLWKDTFNANSGARILLDKIFTLDECYDEETRTFDKNCLIESNLEEE